jgi:hypothetical protein
MIAGQKIALGRIHGRRTTTQPVRSIKAQQHRKAD